MIAVKLGYVGHAGMGKAGVDPVAGIFPPGKLRVSAGGDAGKRGLSLFGEGDKLRGETEGGQIEAARGAVLPPLGAGETVAEIEDGGGVEHEHVVEGDAAVGAVLVDAVNLVQEIVVLVLFPEIVMEAKERAVVFAEGVVQAQ